MPRTVVIAVLALTAAGLAFAPAPTPTTSTPAAAAAPSLAAATDGLTRSPVFEPVGLMESAEHDCLQLTPAATSLDAITGGEPVNLHVRVVLDLADSRALDAIELASERQAAIDARGREIVRDHLAIGAQGYDEINVELDYASFDVLEAPDLRSGERAPTLEGREAIDLAKQQYGGVRPPGTDLVYVLSDRDLTLNGSSGLAGLADCIGGITFPDRAFATGEFDPDAEFSLGVPFYRHYTAKVAAHEVGHLMGAHHHYQACGPYAATSLLDGHGAGACTLMTNFVDFVTFPFSPTNQVVVRGHAERWAD